RCRPTAVRAMPGAARPACPRSARPPPASRATRGFPALPARRAWAGCQRLMWVTTFAWYKALIFFYSSCVISSPLLKYGLIGFDENLFNKLALLNSQTAPFFAVILDASQ